MDLGCIFKLSSFGEDYLPDSSREFRELPILQGFPDSSVGKESACNAGDPGSIPGLGRSAGEGIGYSLQYSWGNLVA